MSEEADPFTRFIVLFVHHRDAGDKELAALCGRSAVAVARQERSLPELARLLYEDGCTAEMIVAGLEAAEHMRRGQPKKPTWGERDRERARLRREECDEETWQVLRGVVFRRDGYRCVYCGSSDSPLEADHVVPVTRGGRSFLRNLVTACKPCNSSKGDRTPEEWPGPAIGGRP